MSAYIVSDKHIGGMLQAVFMGSFPNNASYYWKGERHRMDMDMQEIAQKLVDENYRSVNYRYSESTEPHQFVSERVRALKPVEIIRACDCYSYQSCETDNWEETEAHAIMTALRERAIRALPGYNDAAWEIR